MAKVNYLSYSDARGKVGGIVHTRSRFGLAVRKQLAGINPRTVPQSKVRSDMASISGAWRGLVQIERDAWNSNAATIPAFFNSLGQPYQPSGHQLFCLVNRNIHTFGGGGIKPGPDLWAPPASPTSVVMDLTTPDHIDITWASPTAFGTHFIFFMTPPLSQGVTYLKRSWLRLLAVAPSAWPQPYPLATPFINKFGVIPVTGQKVFLATHLVDDASGQPSAEFILSEIQP